MKTPKVGDLYYEANAWHDAIDELAAHPSVTIDVWVVRTVRRPPKVFEAVFSKRAFCVERNKYTWVSPGRHKPKQWADYIPDYWKRDFAIDDPRQAGLHTTRLAALKAELAKCQARLEDDPTVYARLITLLRTRITREQRTTKRKTND